MKITNDAQFSAAYDLTHALSQSAGRIKGVSLDIENYCTVSLFFEQAYL
ncbi:hypothetical protein IDM42_26070 (plasmid) [Klebsiella pneumoniae]|nr:hypothetical protein [Klebsiella pneumoniae]MBL4555780.1 hypothetical protein [Klebsiella pneumoniae]HBU9642243.1 hypothetical protein [Klebsiella pneumoniae]HBW1161372.1 hypothetical protein [Klebsiella pneumoniae]HCM5937573.1 hypothetical protein [Klebsiella pneumoniae]HCT9281196.1 hypothetical protein [Klebsiella pneumoniae]